jgi:hypothetical protein
MRIDRFSPTGHINIAKELNHYCPREEWAMVVDALHDWYLDRTILEKVAFSPWRLDSGGSVFKDLGSHTTLRLSASGWNWRVEDKAYIELNPAADGDPTVTMQLGTESLATAVKRLHINATPDTLTLYVFCDEDRDWDDFQAFKFAPR